MIGTTLFIAGVEAAVSQQPDGLRAWQLDDEGELIECHRQAQLFLDCPSEKRVVHNLPDLKHLKLELQLWSARQRTLHYLLAGMDKDLRDETRSRRLLAVEEQLADSGCAAFARARLLGCALPAVADLAGALTLARELPRCGKLYQELDAARVHIPLVTQVVRKAIAANVAAPFDGDEVYLRMLDHGVVASAVTVLAKNDDGGVSIGSELQELGVPIPQIIAILLQLDFELFSERRRLRQPVRRRIRVSPLKAKTKGGHLPKLKTA